MKINARAYAGVYKRRGKLVQKPCEKCSDPDTQMHHEDYSKPLDVRWLCRKCHQAAHEELPAALIAFVKFFAAEDAADRARGKKPSYMVKCRAARRETMEPRE